VRSPDQRLVRFTFSFAYHPADGEAARKRYLGHRRVLIAVVRLRGEPIKPSPKLAATIADSVQLARMVLAAVEGRG